MGECFELAGGDMCVNGATRTRHTHMCVLWLSELVDSERVARSAPLPSHGCLPCMKVDEAVASMFFCSIHTYSTSKRHDSDVPAACAQQSTLSDLGRLPMRNTPRKQHFC
eukprot:2926014-Prymnesium_polylepis.1